MAYMDQKRKATIAAKLKEVVPAGWKYGLAVRNHSTIAMSITEAPVDIIGECLQVGVVDNSSRYVSVNTHWVKEGFKPGAVRDAIVAIVDALNEGNHDRSNLQTDYFDVGWYVALSIGRWDKPFVVTQQASA